MQNPLASVAFLFVLLLVPACSDRTPKRKAVEEPAHPLVADADEVLRLAPADRAAITGAQSAVFDALEAALETDPALPELVVVQPDEGATLAGDDQPPRVLWRDEAEAADTWWIGVRIEGKEGVGPRLLVPGSMPAEAALDVFSASLHAWTLSPELWKHVVEHATGKAAVLTLVGFASDAPGTPLSRGTVTIRVSKPR